MVVRRIWLRKLRESKNMTQESLGQLVGLSRTMITEIENGNVNPSVGAAKRIAEILEIDWTKFYENESCDPNKKVI